MTDRWTSPVSSTNKTDRHDITEILLKVAQNAINLTIPNQRRIQKLLLEESIIITIVLIWYKEGVCAVLYTLSSNNNYCLRHLKTMLIQIEESVV